MTPDAKLAKLMANQHADAPTPVLPDYTGACVSNIVPALVQHDGIGRGWLPDVALDATQRVLFVIDGLGTKQLAANADVAPTLSAMAGTSVTTVAPSTTACALTSISTGVAPTEHRIIGYKIRTNGEILNVLRWGSELGDARERIPPREMQQLPSFLGSGATVITKSEFANSGFTMAHLADSPFVGYSVVSTLLTEALAAVSAGERLVYCYYDGIDRVAHEFGFGANYRAELRNVDRLVADLLESLPSDVALVVTADHGQVHVDENHVLPSADVRSMCVAESGEARFRWLHAAPGRADDLLVAAREAHGDVAWVWSIEEILESRMLGPAPSPETLGLLGDVAMVPFEPIAFIQETDKRSLELIGRHGSLTPEEMMVPVLAELGSGSGRLA